MTMHSKLTIKQLLFLSGLWSLALTGWSWLLVQVVQSILSGDHNAWVFLGLFSLVVVASVSQLLLAPARIRVLNDQGELLGRAITLARSR